LDRRLGGLQSRSGRSGEEKNSQPLPGLEPTIIQPVAQRYVHMNTLRASNHHYLLHSTGNLFEQRWNKKHATIKILSTDLLKNKKKN
jgi:hypothetical protein